MANEVYPISDLNGYAATELAVTAKVSANPGSAMTTVEAFSVTNDGGPVRVENLTVTFEASGASNATTPTAVTVPPDATAVILTPPANNTVQLYATNTTATTAVGLKLPLVKPTVYVFDAPLTTFYLLAAKGGAGGVISVKAAWL